MSLLFLTNRDFNIKNIKTGRALCSSIRGYSLVMFYSTQCGHSCKRIPVFRSLPQRIGGCQFGMVDILANMDLVEISRNTVLPIEFVPLIVLYIEGVPYMVYNGEPTVDQISKFIMDVVHIVQKKTPKDIPVNNAKKNPVQTSFGNSKIPMYSIGIPKFDEVSYLEVDCSRDTFGR